MARPKGIPKTGGRQKGTPNRRTRELEAKVEEAAVKIAAVLGDGAFEGDAHAYLMSVYKDPTLDVDVRLDAAKAAAPFEKPRLAAVNHSGEIGLTRDPSELSDAELAAIAAGGSEGAASEAEGPDKLSRIH